MCARGLCIHPDRMESFRPLRYLTEMGEAGGGSVATRRRGSHCAPEVVSGAVSAGVSGAASRDAAPFRLLNGQVAGRVGPV